MIKGGRTRTEEGGKTAVVFPLSSALSPPPSAGGDPWYVRYALIGVTVGIVGVLILGPLVYIFAQAFARGVGAYILALVARPDTRHAVFVTLMVAPLAVAMNTVFGIAAAWLIARYRFRGR